MAAKKTYESLLSEQDRKLWKKVTESVTPKRSTDKQRLNENLVEMDVFYAHMAKPHKKVTKSDNDFVIDAVKRQPPPHNFPPKGHAARPLSKTTKHPHPAATLDRKIHRSIARGRLEIDGKLDLHGLTRDEAYRRLKYFIFEAFQQNKRTLLVITGKGNLSHGAYSSDLVDHNPSGRGVLRQSIPIWLIQPDFKAVVQGFNHADQSHGGTGAYYIRLRKIRA